MTAPDHAAVERENEALRARIERVRTWKAEGAWQAGFGSGCLFATGIVNGGWLIAHWLGWLS